MNLFHHSTDIDCVCTSYDFQEAARRCITSNCTSDDLASAEALQSLECASCESALKVLFPAAYIGSRPLRYPSQQLCLRDQLLQGYLRHVEVLGHAHIEGF